MKTHPTNMFRAVVTIALLEFCLSLSAFAANGVWNVDADGNWSSTVNWSPAAVPGTAAGDVVGLNYNITAARTVTLDTPATVGLLNLGDSVTNYFSYTLTGPSSLTFNNSATGAVLAQNTIGGTSNSIAAPIVLGDNLTINNASGLTLSGVISGAGKNLAKTGAGTLTLNGSAVNTYTGTTTIGEGTSAFGGGTLVEDFANLATPANLINSGSTLVLNGGTLQVIQKSAVNTSQTFNGLTVGANTANAIIATTNTSGVLTVNLGAITRNTGGSVDFTLPAGGNITTTTANDATGILGGWATTGNNLSSTNSGGWVANSGGNIVTYAGYTAVSATGSTTNSLADASSQNWVAGALNGNDNVTTITNSLTVNSLVLQGSLSISSGATLTLGSGGLILRGQSRTNFNNGAANTTGSGQLASGSPSGELYIHTPNGFTNGLSGNNWRFWPKIVDGPFGSTVLIKDGPGSLILQNTNNHSGGTIVNGGTLVLSAGGSIGAVHGPLTINPGATVLTTIADGLGFGASPIPVASPVNIVGGMLTNSSGGNEGFPTTFNFTGGTYASSGGALNTSLSINSFATNVMSDIRGPVSLRSAGVAINTAAGTVPSGIDLRITGVIGQNGGTYGLNKSGPGTLLLTAVSTFAGTTTINAGVLILGDGVSANGSVAGDINNGGTLIIANPNALTYARNISSGTPVIKTGAGTLTLSGANSISGPTTISNGTVIFTAPQSITGDLTLVDGSTLGMFTLIDATFLTPNTLTIGSTTGASLIFGLAGTANPLISPSSMTINGTATVNITNCPLALGNYPLIANYPYPNLSKLTLGFQAGGRSGQLVLSGGTVYYQLTNTVVDVWTAAVSTNWDTTTANWTNSLPANLFVANFPVQFDDTAAGSSPLLVNVSPAAVAAGPVIVSNTVKSYIIGGSAISGPSGLNKYGANTVTLTGVNTFSGPTVIANGALVIGGAGQLGGGTYSSVITNNGTLNYASSAAQTLSGNLTGSGMLIKTNTGTLTLSGPNNDYAGGTTNAAGVIIVGNASALGTGKLTLNGGGVIPNGVTLEIDNPIFVDAGGGILQSNITAANPDITFGGNITGSGPLTLGGCYNQNGLFLSGDNSGYSGTVTVPAAAGGVRTGGNNRLATANSGSAAAKWVVNGNFEVHTVGPTTYQLGELSGTNLNAGISGHAPNTSPTIETLVVGALNTSSSYVGIIVNNAAQNLQTGNSDAAAFNNLSLNKIGTGTLTLGGAASSYTGGTILTAGVLALATNDVAATSTGPLGNNNPTNTITFNGGTLQYSLRNNSDYSARIANSTAAIKIDLNGTNVTYAATLAANNTGGLTLTNSTGSGNLTLTAVNSYGGNTVVNAGTLALSGGGSIPSTNIFIGALGKLDVSGLNYKLGASQTLNGFGVVTGSVATASGTATISPGNGLTVGALTFNNAVILTNGSVLNFKMSTITNSGNNDQIVLSNPAGTLSLNFKDTLHINALSGATPLAAADYLLFSVAGATAMPTKPVLVFDAPAPSNANHYAINTNGSNVILKYDTVGAPTVTVSVSPTAAIRGQTVVVTATVTPGDSPSVTNCVADLSAIGGSASAVMNDLGGNQFSITTTVGVSALPGSEPVTATATDMSPRSGSGLTYLTVNTTTETWDGLATDDNWGSATNWTSNLAPGYVGDSLIFTGNTRTSPIVENDYSVAGVTFNSLAGPFTITATAGKSLTLTGGIINNSTNNAQALNLPIILNGSQVMQDVGLAGIGLGGNVSGSGGLTLATGTFTVAGANAYTGNTVISNLAAVKLLNSAAIPSGSGMGNVIMSGSLDLNGNSVTINGLTADGSSFVTNSSASPVTLTLGGNNQGGGVAGSINDNGSGILNLVKIGNNNLTLSAANNYNGGTVISNGTVVAGDGGSFGNTGLLTLAGGGVSSSFVQTPSVTTGALIANPLFVAAGTTNTIGHAAAQTVTFTGNLTGSGVINNFPDSLMTTSPSFYFAGDASAFTGTFVYSNLNTPNNGLWLRFGSFGQIGGTWDGSNAKFVALGFFNHDMGFPDNSQDLTVRLGSLTGNSFFQGPFNGTAGIYTFDHLEVGFLNLNETFSGGLGQNFGFEQNFDVKKVGTGTWTLTGPSYYIGTTTVSGGTLYATTLSTGGGAYSVADGTTLGVNVVSGGTLRMFSLDLGNCSLSFSGLSSTVVPAITCSNTATAGTVTVNVNSGVLFTGQQYPLLRVGSPPIGGSPNFVLGSLPPGVAANVGTVTTSSNVTVVLNVTAGTIPIFWTGLTSTNWDFTTVNWLSNSASSLYGDGVLAVFDDTSTRTNVSVAVTVAPGTIILSNNVRNYAFTSTNGAKITGGSGLIKNNNGTLTLTNLNADFAGGVIINGGVIEASSSTNLGAAGSSIALAGGTLSVLNTYSNTQTFSTGPATGSGNGTISVASNQTLFVSSSIVNYGNGSGTLVKSGGGTLILNAAKSTYSGGTFVNAGALVLTNFANNGPGAIGGGPLSVNTNASVSCLGVNTLGFNAGLRVEQITLNNGLASTIAAGDQGNNTTYYMTGGELRANGGTNTPASASYWLVDHTNGYPNFDINTFPNTSSAIISGRLHLRNDGTSIFAFNVASGTAIPDLSVAAAITEGSAGLGIVKVNTGTMILGATNAYTGSTTVSNGTLLVNGIISNSVAVNGGTFGGRGAVLGSIALDPGTTFAPGGISTNIGTLTVATNLTLNGNMQVRLNKSFSPGLTNDSVVVGGIITNTAAVGTLTLVNNGSTLVAGDKFKLFSSAFAGGSGMTLSPATPASGLVWSNRLALDGTILVVAPPVTVNTNPPVLQVSVSGGNTLNLGWPANLGWTLQTNAVGLASANQWFTYPGSAALTNVSIPINPGGSNVFFRMVYTNAP